MCIMEVHVNQHSSTIAQACAHNVGTVVGDLKLFLELLGKRDPSMVGVVENELSALTTCYDNLLSVFGDFVAKEAPHLRPYALPIGNERAEDAIARQDEQRARRYETR